MGSCCPECSNYYAYEKCDFKNAYFHKFCFSTSLLHFCDSTVFLAAVTGTPFLYFAILKENFKNESYYMQVCTDVFCNLVKLWSFTFYAHRLKNYTWFP